MSFNFSPKIVQNGLVFCFDPSNNKSFISGSTSAVDIKSNTTLTFKNKIYNGGTGDIVTIISPTYDTNNNGSIYFNGVDSLSGDGLYLPISDTTTNLTSQVTLFGLKRQPTRHGLNLQRLKVIILQGHNRL